jgi:hypothetical protein
MSLVGVALLMGLCSQYVGMDLSHFLFCLCHNVGAKDNPFARFGPTERCTTGSSIVT